MQTEMDLLSTANSADAFNMRRILRLSVVTTLLVASSAFCGGQSHAKLPLAPVIQTAELHEAKRPKPTFERLTRVPQRGALPALAPVM